MQLLDNLSLRKMHNALGGLQLVDVNRIKIYPSWYWRYFAGSVFTFFAFVVLLRLRFNHKSIFQIFDMTLASPSHCTNINLNVICFLLLWGFTETDSMSLRLQVLERRIWWFTVSNSAERCSRMMMEEREAALAMQHSSVMAREQKYFVIFVEILVTSRHQWMNQMLLLKNEKIRYLWLWQDCNMHVQSFHSA